jgi:hypothetical protein
MVSAFVLAVVVAAVVVAARSGHRPAAQLAPPPATRTAEAPYQLGINIVCPLGRPVLATSNHASYPPGHPGHPPPGVHPVGCYPTVAQASAAGYPPAPLPAGARQLGGVYLAPTDQAFGVRCQLAADRIGLVVPCPGLLPTSAPGTAPPQLCGRACGRVFLLDDGGFLVPPDYLGVEKQPQGHLVIVAAPSPTDGQLGCFGQQRMATVKVNNHQAVLLRCPMGSELNSGHVLVRWSQQGVVMVVSLHGWSTLNQQLVLVLAEHLRLLSPKT